jgi:hypothetical protein
MELGAYKRADQRVREVPTSEAVSAKRLDDDPNAISEMIRRRAETLVVDPMVRHMITWRASVFVRYRLFGGVPIFNPRFLLC